MSVVYRRHLYVLIFTEKETGGRRRGGGGGVGRATAARSLESVNRHEESNERSDVVASLKHVPSPFSCACSCKLSLKELCCRLHVTANLTKALLKLLPLVSVSNDKSKADP